jgi:hypothetical protein
MVQRVCGLLDHSIRPGPSGSNSASERVCPRLSESLHYSVSRANAANSRDLWVEDRERFRTKSKAVETRISVRLGEFLDLDEQFSKPLRSGHVSATPGIVPCGNANLLQAACSIRVSIKTFVRIQRIVRNRQSLKFFVFNNRQWFESHPLRHPSLAFGELRLGRRVIAGRRMAHRQNEIPP